MNRVLCYLALLMTACAAPAAQAAPPEPEVELSPSVGLRSFESCLNLCAVQWPAYDQYGKSLGNSWYLSHCQAECGLRSAEPEIQPRISCHAQSDCPSGQACQVASLLGPGVCGTP
jgi:hypothetical protein